MTEEAKSTGSEESKGLSSRDALEVAYESLKPENQEREIKTSPLENIEEAKADSEKPEEPEIPAPAEFTAEEKEDFKSLTPSQKEAALRLHNKRQAKLAEIKAATKEFKELKSLNDSIAPYLKAVGVKKPTEVALKEALEMWREFHEGDPKLAAAAYLEAKGVAVPKELLEGTQNQKPDPNQSALQNRLSHLENIIASNATQAQAQVLGQAWGAFEKATNAGGKPRFPDVGDTESGLRMAANIGSLVRGDTPLSQQFIAQAKARIPGLTYQGLLTEAYRYCGGRVDDSEATRTQESQKQHIVNSSRAAASKPGRGAPVASSGQVKKFKTYREAAAAALAELKSD